MCAPYMDGVMLTDTQKLCCSFTDITHTSGPPFRLFYSKSSDSSTSFLYHLLPEHSNLEQGITLPQQGKSSATGRFAELDSAKTSSCKTTPNRRNAVKLANSITDTFWRLAHQALELPTLRILATAISAESLRHNAVHSSTYDAPTASPNLTVNNWFRVYLDNERRHLLHASHIKRVK